MMQVYKFPESTKTMTYPLESFLPLSLPVMSTCTICHGMLVLGIECSSACTLPELAFETRRAWQFSTNLRTYFAIPSNKQYSNSFSSVSSQPKCIVDWCTWLINRESLINRGWQTESLAFSLYSTVKSTGPLFVRIRDVFHELIVL